MDADFDNADLPRASGDQLPHFMKWTISPYDWMNWGWYPKDDASILVMENDYQTLTDFVDGIRMHDGTATHIGMKYGLALLNPSSRDEIQELNARGLVADAYQNRPSDWEDDVVKYVVLMTDGKTTSQFRPKFPDPSGTGSANWSYDPINDALAGAAMLSDGTDGGTPPAMSDDLAEILDRYGSFDSSLDPNPPSVVEDGYPGTTTFNDGGTIHNESTNNGHITAMCDEAKKPVYETDGAGDVMLDGSGAPVVAKQDRVTVFTIAFVAPASAQTLMRDCASSDSHYFEVEDLEIETAFQAIAKTINQLRLSQ